MITAWRRLPLAVSLPRPASSGRVPARSAPPWRQRRTARTSAISAEAPMAPTTSCGSQVRSAVMPMNCSAALARTAPTMPSTIFRTRPVRAPIALEATQPASPPTMSDPISPSPMAPSSGPQQFVDRGLGAGLRVHAFDDHGAVEVEVVLGGHGPRHDDRARGHLAHEDLAGLAVDDLGRFADIDAHAQHRALAHDAALGLLCARSYL